MNKPLLVLDTNVVLDLLHFDDATARPILGALQDSRAHCVVTPATLEELRRVLAYPAFGLTPEQQTAHFARYQSLSRLDEAGTMPVRLPVCSDRDDQKFLELAASAGVSLLVTKDRALLKLRRRCAPWFAIVTPAEAVLSLAEINQQPEI